MSESSNEHSDAIPDHTFANGVATPDIWKGMGIMPRTISEKQWIKYEQYMTEIFTALGLPAGTESTSDTPQRFLRALFEATNGYEGDAKLVRAFSAEHNGGLGSQISQVVEGPIPFYSLCEHHCLPFFGTAYIGYIADEHILGLSKLTRLVRLFARRFSVQERLGQQLADAMQRIVNPHGVAIYLDAVHMCTQMRGVLEVGTRTRTTNFAGTYESDIQLRSEFFALCEHK